MENEKLVTVTEVGTFGNLNMDDPTVMEVTKADENLDAVIEQSIQANKAALAGK